MPRRLATRKDRPVHSEKLRSFAKKGGRGRFGWGAPGDEMDIPEMDRNDPCYYSGEEDDSYVLISREEQERSLASKAGISIRAHDRRVAAVPVGSPPRYSYDPAKAREKPIISLPLFKKKVIKILREYFVSADIEETGRCLQEIHCPVFHYEFVKRGITMAMDRHNSKRESVSKLISGLYPKVLSTNQIGKAFERLFEQIDGLALDTPGAHGVLTKFLSRAVLDEVLPPAFLSDPVVVSVGGTIIEKAKVMLSCSHGLARLEHVWGPSAGRPVNELKAVIKQIINEFLLSGDVDEAAKCVRELDVGHFHHEVVKRAVVISMDRTTVQQRRVSKLFEHLVQQEVITKMQLQMGFERLVQVLPDMTLDVPAAAGILQAFIADAIGSKLLPEDFATTAPSAPVSSPSKAVAAAAAASSARKNGTRADGSAAP